MDFYGSEYKRNVINFDPDVLFSFYVSNDLYDAISSHNQFTITNFITSGYSRIHLDDLKAWRMKCTFYTIASLISTALTQFDVKNRNYFKQGITLVKIIHKV